jgi:hypothetical protein
MICRETEPHPRIQKKNPEQYGSTSGWDLQTWETRPLLALVAFYQQALYVYISQCGAQHRPLRPGRGAAGGGVMLFLGDVFALATRS